ncbi:MAG: hypothetical protein IJ197_02065 [Bacteroidaceae bacterium]|nr:hypothetical protein [Bacteroidaceae bacterium]
MRRISLTLIVLISCLSMFSQETIDYLNVGKTIKFGKQKLSLAWSSHPVDYYYIQEWLPKGENFDNYSQMFTLSLHFSEELTPLIAAQNKAAELEERGKNDKICHYNILENGDEYIVDFLVSDTENGLVKIVEHDVHHYKQVISYGKKALQLTFISERSYGDDIMPFLQSLKDRRENVIMDLTQMNIKCKVK